MNKLCTALICLSVSAWAWSGEIENTNSIEMPDRQKITLGDKLADMQIRISASPIEVRSYAFSDALKKDALAVDYSYEIENMHYVITVIDDQVYKIQQENLNK